MDEAIEQYAWLVRAIVKRYPLPDGWEREDMEQWGSIGLWNALRRYDPDGLHKGYTFLTIARFAINSEIDKHMPPEMKRAHRQDIADEDTISMPVVMSLQPPTWMQSRITRELEALPSNEPSVEQQVMTALDGAQVSATIEAALLLLSERQRAIIERRFGLSGDGACWTQEEVGRYLGIHKSNVCRTQQKALMVLRRHLSATTDGALVLIQLDEKRRQRRRKARAA